MKVYNALNGLFYLLFGLTLSFFPLKMPGFGETELSLLALHEMRAMYMAMAGAGLLALLYTAKLSDQKPLTLAFIFVILAFATGRLLGLVMDGAGPQLTYMEIGFEVFWAALGGVLYKRG